MSITKMQKRGFITLIACTLSSMLSAQCPTTTYNIPDTICAGDVFSVTNSGSSSSSYLWDFCAGEIKGSPNTSSTYSAGSGSLGSDIILENGNWYVFVANNGSISKFDFGNSLSNVPTHTNLGSFGGLMTQASDIKFANDNGTWYALVPSWQNRITRLTFGNSVANVPTANQMVITSSNFNFPYNMTLEYDNGNYVALTANLIGNFITVADFGTTLANDTPAVSTIAITGTATVGVAAAKDCGNWYAFVTHANSSTMNKIEFGNSLSNVPSSVTDISASGDLFSSRQIELVRENGEWIAFTVDGGGTILKRLNFGSSLDSIPVYSSTPGY
ncbi:MAG: hypothetical protein HKN22_06145, partial [Bacteroidia bacterium]|nr:hypothetical protein [Bacteroidia bacterium]